MSGPKGSENHDFSDVSEENSTVEEKKVGEDGDGHKEEIPDSIWEDTGKLFDEAQRLIDEGRAACKREISILQKMIDRKKTKEQLEEDKKKLNRN